jgi:hypothetical protein
MASIHRFGTSTTASGLVDERFTLQVYNNTDSITCTSGLSKYEVSIRLTGPIFELTNERVFLSSAWLSRLSDDRTKSSIMREHPIQPVLKEGYRQGLCQGLHFV